MLHFLLDEHISPDVADGLRRIERTLVIHAMPEWQEGRYLGEPDEAILAEATKQKLTLATYDRRTITPLLKTWAEEGRSHAGVIFVDDKTISPSDIGGLTRALHQLCKQSRDWDWTDRITFLRR